jgi:hypothetical protein
MSEKTELLKTLGLSDELLKYFEDQVIESPVSGEDVILPQNVGSFDLAELPNFDQIEVAGTMFTFSSKK